MVSTSPPDERDVFGISTALPFPVPSSWKILFPDDRDVIKISSWSSFFRQVRSSDKLSSGVLLWLFATVGQTVPWDE
jgi:hypothetical protein